MTAPIIKVNRYVWLIAGVAAVGVALYMLRGALFPFILGGALAYIMHPLVTWLEKRMPGRNRRPVLARVLSIFIMFAVMAGLLAGALIVVLPPVVEQFRLFIDSLPVLISDARVAVENWNRELSGAIPEEIRLQIQEAIQNAGVVLVGAAQGIMVRTIGVVSGALTIVIGLAALPLFLYYVLKDREKLVDGMVSVFPPGPRVHARNVITVVNHVFSSYVRAQLLLGLVVGVLVFIGLTLLGVKFAIILAVVAGVFELVPIIGPWLGAIPGIVVVLATSPEKFFWVVLVYFGVQLLENSLLVPRIQSRALHVHPVLILVVIIVGSEVAGLWGVILGPPLVVAGKEVFDYFVEEWSSTEITPLADPEVNGEHVLRTDQDGSAADQAVADDEQAQVASN
ncbi:MAG: AI-2E family transporter [Chloroflexi bacterium]|nr:AI-2E family transporter [Chloroflexota bacterium]MCI0790404.1 AI-2E family transporter [Chloroflexota bacterium]MCI0795373.1 AI-2E family transporter [Chloroflexota bacterium]MCI0868410.1 AI-2E family transporter [Chloroflexota bacterium]MCI0886782.1 AI-2E family transporter [Chloroflexota bacterium]